MNNQIVEQLTDCVERAKDSFYIKTQDSFGNFQYYKGRLVGIGNTCKRLGYEEEFELVNKAAKEYPFDKDF